MNPKTDDFSAPLMLGADLGIETALSLKAQLLEHLHDLAPVRIDAGAVRRIHAAAVQLFCVFCRERLALGRSVEFLRASDCVRMAAAQLDASTLLRLPASADAVPIPA